MLFVIKDKSGRKIHLSRERWGHIQKHPEMCNQLQNMINTLKSPDKIIHFKFDPQVRMYFKRINEIKRFIMVSVKYLNGTGFIITSFCTDKIK